MDDNDGLGVDTLAMRREPFSTMGAERPGPEASPVGDPVEDRGEFERCQVDLLSARDALVGSLAEKAAAQGRVQDLDLQVYMLTLERDDLRAENELLRQRLGRRGLRGRLRAAARSLVRGLRGA